MSAKITAAPFTFSAEKQVQATRWPHPRGKTSHKKTAKKKKSTRSR